MCAIALEINELIGKHTSANILTYAKDTVCLLRQGNIKLFKEIIKDNTVQQ